MTNTSIGKAEKVRAEMTGEVFAVIFTKWMLPTTIR
jgi:hypothetical protein